MRFAAVLSFSFHASVIIVLIIGQWLFDADAAIAPEDELITRIRVIDPSSAPIPPSPPPPLPEPPRAAQPRPPILKSPLPEPAAPRPPKQPAAIALAEPPPESSQSAQSVDLTSSLVGLRERVESCWQIPARERLPGVDPIIKLRIFLDQRGNLAPGRDPVWVNRTDHPYRRAAAHQAIQAVRRCAPYSLPAQHHSLWREIILSFNWFEATRKLNYGR